jgi:hypothetical protein
MMPQVDELLKQLEEHKDKVGEKTVGTKSDKDWIGFWDDWCLAKFFKGVCSRYLAYPVSSITLQIQQK